MNIYICNCTKTHNTYSNWWLECNCKFCIRYEDDIIKSIRVRVNDKNCIFGDFKSIATIENFFKEGFESYKNIDDFNSENIEQYIKYLIKYSENIIFE